MVDEAERRTKRLAPARLAASAMASLTSPFSRSIVA
jgi:hypothetical protein